MTSALADYSSFVEDRPDGRHTLSVLVDGMRCAACAFSIESDLNAQPEVQARINVTARRLDLQWSGETARGNQLLERVQSLGFSPTPYQPDAMAEGETREIARLFRYMAVAGFGSANLMMFSVPLWAGMDAGVLRDSFHWLSALVALPVVVYSGQPYYRSAFAALKAGHTNMDVPITLAIILATAMSLFETIRGGPYVYFDSAVMLLFFLLIGRWLDVRARSKARGAAHDLLLMMNGWATIERAGVTARIPIRDVAAGMIVLVQPGERIATDGTVLTGETDIDTSAITGESVPVCARPGTAVISGTINLTAPIRVQAGVDSADTQLAAILALMQQAEQRQTRAVQLADRMASWYTPVVHILAAITFLGWWLSGGAPWQVALIYATTVLIITCPCAMGLAVPAVHVLASGRLFRSGILLKSADALEQLAEIDTVVFDKTGTLTEGRPVAIALPAMDGQTAARVGALAASSQHPLARALAAQLGGGAATFPVREVAGCGMEGREDGQRLRLGSRAWCGDTALAQDDAALELWFNDGVQRPLRFTFADQPRADAARVTGWLAAKGLERIMLSGDRTAVAEAVGHALGIADARGDVRPQDKSAIVSGLTAAGRKVLMVGDGMNDAPALVGATVSMSPASGLDIAQNAADLVYRGEALAPVVTAIQLARRARVLVRQNMALSLFYNLGAVPLAMAGLISPILAAILMSASSITVVANALRINQLEEAR